MCIKELRRKYHCAKRILEIGAVVYFKQKNHCAKIGAWRSGRFPREKLRGEKKRTFSRGARRGPLVRRANALAKARG
jgi:hypothetical protein